MPAQPFSALAGDFLAEQYADHPVRSSGMGLTEFDDQLDDLSGAAFERRAASAAAWRQRFAEVGEADMTFDEAIDRDLIVGTLTEQSVYDEWRVWERHPDTYLNPGMRGVFVLFLHGLRPEAELAASAAARLRQVPDSLAAGRANLRPELVPEILLDRAINQARAGANYTRVLLPAQVAEENRAELAEPGRWRRTPSRTTPASWSRCARRPTATGPSARSATTPCSATRRCSPSTPEPCARGAGSRSRS